jgi:1,4-alpha-glucan branching enzyme
MAKAKAPQPKAGSTRKVIFSVHFEGARAVSITGDFTKWSKEGLRLDKGPNGEWHATLNLAPGEHQYRLLVDGEWRDNPKAPKRVPNPFGSENCVLTVT